MFPDLFAPNPASHLIWWVAGLLFALLGVILLTEVWDWARGLVGRWRSGAGGEAAPGTDPDRWQYHEPDTELRHRHHHRVEAYRRTWHEGRPNEPAG